MKCIETEMKFDAMIDAELDPSEIRKIEEHLKDCVSCNANLENMRVISQSVRQTLAVAAPSSLDEKVFQRFEAFKEKKRSETVRDARPAIAWFGIPRFFIAAACILISLSLVSAFQIGRMTAGEISIVIPDEKETESGRPLPQVVEIPVIQEKIVMIPVVREKIVVRTVFVDKTVGKSLSIAPVTRKQDNFAFNSSVAENGYMTQANLKGFEPVSEIRAKITREDKEDEK